MGRTIPASLVFGGYATIAVVLSQRRRDFAHTDSLALTTSRFRGWPGSCPVAASKENFLFGKKDRTCLGNVPGHNAVSESFCSTSTLHSDREGQFWFGTDRLWANLPTDGIWKGLPRDTTPGHPTFFQKLFWWRQGYEGRAEPRPKLTVTGKRLDFPAPPPGGCSYNYCDHSRLFCHVVRCALSNDSGAGRLRGTMQTTSNLCNMGGAVGLPTLGGSLKHMIDLRLSVRHRRLLCEPRNSGVVNTHRFVLTKRVLSLRPF